jgi:hypothetical protein
MSIAKKFEVIADEVYEKGKKDEHDKFWDANQDYGNRTNYIDFYNGSRGWTKDNFYPKYDITPIGNANQLFYAWEIEDKHTMDLSERLRECGVVLNTKQATSLQYAFAYVRFKSIPPIDVTGLSSNSSLLFGDSRAIQTIERLTIAETTPINSNWFRNVVGLKTLIVEGTIGQNGFNVQWSTKLSGESIVSIIEALSTTTSGLTVTLSQTAVNNMVFPIVGKKGTYNSWTDLEQSRTNWTISLL